jgi:hypothetical protein
LTWAARGLRDHGCCRSSLDHTERVTGLWLSLRRGSWSATSASRTSRLLDLQGLAVDRVEVDDDGARVVHVVTADETASACPSCGALSSAVKQRVRTRPRDHTGQGAAAGVAQAVAVRARRLRPGLVHRDGARGAGPGEVDHPAAGRAGAGPAGPGIRSPGGGCWSATGGTPVSSTPPGTAGCSGEVEGRSAAAVTGWLTAQPQDWRDAVTHVAIDGVRLLRQGRPRGPPGSGAGRRPVPPHPAGQRRPDRGPPAGDPRGPGPPRPQGRPGLAGPSAAAHRARAAAPGQLRPDVELVGGHR